MATWLCAVSPPPPMSTYALAHLSRSGCTLPPPPLTLVGVGRPAELHCAMPGACVDACAWFRDNHNAEVWLWLSLLCLTSATARVPEGAQSLEQALVLVRAGWAPCTPTPPGASPLAVLLCVAGSCGGGLWGVDFPLVRGLWRVTARLCNNVARLPGCIL